jgi:4a-hydroxytetrahydrobiopterin dehydratase
MPAAPLLSSAQIASRLAALPRRLADGRLMRTFKTRDFRSALELVTRLADPADEQNHHPDVSIHWNVVTLTLWTHASDGITERDFLLAESIERILEKVEPLRAGID